MRGTPPVFLASEVRGRIKSGVFFRNSKTIDRGRVAGYNSGDLIKQILPMFLGDKQHDTRDDLWNEYKMPPDAGKDIAGSPELSKAFNFHSTCACIDEGTPFGTIRLAGSGILQPGGAEAVAKILLEAGAEEVTSHDGCGAAALWTKNNGGDEKAADEYGKKFAREVVGKMSEISGKEIKYRHISKEEMKRPEHLHVAKCAYYDGTGLFNPDNVAGLPEGFVVSRRFLDKEQALFNADLAVQIALGHHGFGDKFTKDESFVIFAVGNPKDKEFSAEKLLAELEPLVAKYGGRVKLESFSAPND